MKTNSFICTFFLILLGLNAYGQISTNEMPVSFSMKNTVAMKSNAKMMKSLPSLDMEKIRQEDLADESIGIPPRFGYKHKVNYNLENSGTWTNLPNGDRIWNLEISCPGAKSINLLYDKFQLPEGAKFFIYSSDKKHSMGAFTSANNKGSKENIRGFTTGFTYADRVTLEYYLPEHVKEQGVISVESVVQGYRFINSQENTTKSVSSENCNININCIEGQNWQNEKNAVALIIANGNRYCSGALINNTANDASPLFLTASHCMSNIDVDDIIPLDHWILYWNYEAPDCDYIAYEPPIYSTVGGDLLANNTYSDFAIVRLAEDPKNLSGFTPYYLGWDRTGNPGTGGVGIHHPNGSIKKIAVHSATPVKVKKDKNSTNSHLVFWEISWASGSTAGISSGSPLINNNHHVIGQLYGGKSACGNGIYSNGPDIYGAFDDSWTSNNTTDRRRRLRDWLDPSNTGIIVLDGRGVCSDNFENQTVASNKTVTGCNNLNVQNITVSSNAKLILNAPSEVIINGPFEVQQGSSMDIK